MQNPKPETGGSRAFRSTPQNRTAAALLFSAAVAVPYLHAILPDDLWYDLYWPVSTFRSTAFFWCMAMVLPYDLRGFKVAFTALAAVTSFALLADAWSVPYAWNTVASATLWLLTLYGLWRGYAAPKIGGTPEPGYDGAYILRIPIHGWVGIWQAILMPWHHARYETRVVVERNKAWYIHKGRFWKINTGGERLLCKGDAQPLGRDLTAAEIDKLNDLEGKRRIFGIRD